MYSRRPPRTTAIASDVSSSLTSVSSALSPYTVRILEFFPLRVTEITSLVSRARKMRHDLG